MEGSVAEKWKDRLGKKVKVRLDFISQVVTSWGWGLGSVAECFLSKHTPSFSPQPQKKIVLLANIVQRKPPLI